MSFLLLPFNWEFLQNLKQDSNHYGQRTWRTYRTLANIMGQAANKPFGYKILGWYQAGHPATNNPTRINYARSKCISLCK